MPLPTEVTERLNLLERLYEAAPQGVWILDAAGTTTAVSPAMRRMLGRDERSLAGRISSVSVSRCSTSGWPRC
ncbi:MAG: PAS domain-containing protein [Rubrivivax sp.]